MTHFKDSRQKGAAWVSAQIIIFALYGFVPHFIQVLPFPRLPWPGSVLMLYGMGIAIPALWKLGRALTPFPRPLDGADLIVTGPYAWVRNPIYSGLSALALGYALWTGDGMRLAWSGVVFLFLDRKSRAEERWLESRFPEYAAYRHRVKKLIPFFY